eukprot:9471411-Pyramimonas_sp.AAC.2
MNIESLKFPDDYDATIAKILQQMGYAEMQLDALVVVVLRAFWGMVTGWSRFRRIPVHMGIHNVNSLFAKLRQYAQSVKYVHATVRPGLPQHDNYRGVGRLPMKLRA